VSGSTFEDRIGYARAVVDGDWVHVSGTTGFDYTTMTIPDDVVAQADQCLANIGADFEPCWPVLREYFGDVRPAATMQVCGLADPRMRIEIEVTAHRGSATGNAAPGE
jgi:enamine deaminase RidA (YjgF/YER057c/UK114 family)